MQVILLQRLCSFWVKVTQTLQYCTLLLCNGCGYLLLHVCCADGDSLVRVRGDCAKAGSGTSRALISTVHADSQRMPYCLQVSLTPKRMYSLSFASGLETGVDEVSHALACEIKYIHLPHHTSSVCHIELIQDHLKL